MENQRIRRVSMDKFYEIVTGDKEAFYKICMELPTLIDEIIEENKELQVGSDTVVDELREKNPDLYILSTGNEENKKAIQISEALRDKDVYVENDVLERSFKAQMKYADKLNAKFLLVIGENELSSNKAKIKDMKTGNEIEISLNIDEILKNIK